MQRGSVRGVAAICICAGALSGCGNTIYQYQKTTLGIHASVSAAEQGGSLDVGYKRRFAAIVPEVEEGKGAGEAASVVSCTEVTKADLLDFSMSEQFATGAAAIAYANKVAKEGEKKAVAFNCFGQLKEAAQ